MTNNNSRIIATTPEGLGAAGFTRPTDFVPRRLIANVAGHEKTGKTDFALTAEPPIMFFNYDHGDEGVMKKALAAGQEIYEYSPPYDKTLGADAALQAWVTLKDRVYRALGVGKGTLIFDTGSEMWEHLRLARLKKLTQVKPHHYGPVNDEWRELIRDVYESGMSAIFLNKLKKMYVGDQWGGAYEQAGFADMKYLVQANLLTTRVDNPEGGLPAFGIYVQDCRQNAEITGMTADGPFRTWPFVLSMVHDNIRMPAPIAVEQAGPPIAAPVR